MNGILSKIENEATSFLFIMDPYDTLNLETETSLLLMGELLQRGVKVYWAELDDLVLRQNTLAMQVRSVVKTFPFHLEGRVQMLAEDFDAIIVRPDPPFDETYLQLTYLLDFVPDHVKQFNRPEALRSLNEKLLPLTWPHLTPATVTTMNTKELLAFLEEHKDIVVKPLGDCSGRGVVRVTIDMPDAHEQLRSAVGGASGKRVFVTAQEFLPAIKNGDKRVFLVGGKPVGIVNRIPAEGSFMGNIHQGARCVAATLSSAEERALAEIAPYLKAKGVLFAGADFIGDKLTEINITSPSAMRQINDVSDTDIHPIAVDAMLAALQH